MKNKEHELARFLLDKGCYVPSSIISSSLDISRRTIIAYVSNINSAIGETAIISNNKGYYAIPEMFSSFFNEEKLTIPQGYIDRAYYVIKKILIEHKSTNIFDLCEELCISYSTLKSDLQHYNLTFEKYNVKFCTKNSNLMIIGSEADKRKLISFVIFEEANNGFVDLSQLNNLFTINEVNAASQLVNDICKTYKAKISDFSRINLITHVLIMEKRIKEGNTLIDENNINDFDKTDNYERFDKVDKNVLSIIQSFFEKECSTKINNYEQLELLAIFNGYITSNDNFSKYKIKNNDNNINIDSIVNNIIKEVNETYAIDISSELFITSFSLHLKLFFNRVNSGHFSKNPLKDAIKMNCPVIYDIAVYITSKLKQYFEIPQIEDEIAYFALHVGSELTRQNNKDARIRCVLFCPKYLKIQSNLISQLSKYEEDLVLIKSVSNLSELEDLNFSLLISVVPAFPTDKYQVFNISSNIFDNPFYKLEETIRNIRKREKKQQLIENFNNIFNEDLFLCDDSITNKEEVIKLLCNTMFNKGYVQSDFYNSVLERERASSTSFNNVAIPHAMIMDAVKTSVGIFISKKGIVWDDTIVYLVFLPSVTSFDRALFGQLYESVLGVFSDEDNYNISQKLESFDDFKSLIYRG